LIVPDQINTLKQELHKEIDAIFDISKFEPDYKITMSDFSKKSEQFSKKYYTLVKDTNDILFENDISIPLIHKERYRKQKDDASSLKYDTKVMPVIETINMLSSPGTHNFNDFSKMLVDSIKFLFTCYSFLYSMYLPKWVKKVDDIKELNEASLQLKQLLNSFAEDLYLCFNTANIPQNAKVPLIMLYSSELQDRVNIRLAESLSAEEIAIKIAEQVLRDNFGKLDMNTIMDSMTQTHKFARGQNSEHLQIAYYRLLKIMVDLFMSNMTSHILRSPLKPKTLTTETKMKLIDLKHNFMTELEQEFDRIK
jgi:hypothetical protein